MSKADELIERAVNAVVTRAPGRVVALIALAFYPGLGLVLPLAIGASVPNLVSLNVIGVAMAAVFSLGWLALQVQAKDRRHLVEWTTSLRLLSAQEFEWLVGELFRREGWKVRETGRQDGPDGNIDLELTSGTDRCLVQCKRWTARQIPLNEIRAFAGTLLREHLSGNRGVYVTLSDFNEQARDEAKRTGIMLVDGRELHRRLERARRAEPCPICEAPMVLDRSTHGWWFRCVTRDCQGKRDLGREPGRAVELLSEPPALASGQVLAD